ncbi:stomatin [Schizosaccharomyces osmophilus]|uniref:Stomatin n=1 Tax=Schizosaccharomyces osmophilus TaxID=2545709 RepID=A0AAE9WFV3_9SCHI|nr:stomatin [Schizosaccharomyces osmophilus]WBW74457.1 stomatin [Schizosaccharomyces osmophilus]
MLQNFAFQALRLGRSNFRRTGAVKSFGFRYKSDTSSSLNLFTPVWKDQAANTIIKFVPQQMAYVVERMGRFSRILTPGLAFLVPVADKISYIHCLKERALEIPTQSAITLDNVSIGLDGVLYIQVYDPYKASYGIEDADYAISQLAQTTMRSEIGRLTLDHVLRERQSLNEHISEAINKAAENWGIRCLRHEIRDIRPPESVVMAMHQQVSAERQKRAEILASEGKRQSVINVAEGDKQSEILDSESQKIRTINAALAEAQAIRERAFATAKGIDVLSDMISQKDHGADAVNLHVAEQYLKNFGNLAKTSNTMILPATANDISSMVTQALSIYKQVSNSPAPSNSLHKEISSLKSNSAETDMKR